MRDYPLDIPGQLHSSSKNGRVPTEKNWVLHRAPSCQWVEQGGILSKNPFLETIKNAALLLFLLVTILALFWALH